MIHEFSYPTASSSPLEFPRVNSERFEPRLQLIAQSVNRTQVMRTSKRWIAFKPRKRNNVTISLVRLKFSETDIMLHKAVCFL